LTDPRASDDDQLQTFMLENAPVRGAVVRLNDSWRHIQTRHDYPEDVKTYLGQTLAATVLLASRIKLDGSMIMQTHGDGPLHTLVAQTTSEYQVRGLARWHGDGVPGSARTALGKGRLVMTIDNRNAERYQGIVAFDGEPLAEVLQAYFTQSEQLQTRLWLWADADVASGLLIQALPAEVEEDWSGGENWRRVLTLAATLRDDELRSLAPKSLIRRLFHEERPRAFEPKTVAFKCGCSLERIENMLVSLGEAEVNDIVAEQGSVSVDCEFCNKRYELDRVDAKRLFVERNQPQVPPTRH